MVQSRKRDSTLKEERNLQSVDQCSQGDRCSLRHETQYRAQKPERNAATFWALSRRRGERSIRAKRNRGAILRQPCRYYLKCTQLPCEYWHPLESVNSTTMKRVVRLERVCFRIRRLMNNQIKIRKKLLPKKKRKRWQDCCGCCEVYHKIQMHSFLMVEGLGETRCKKSWNFKGYNSPCLRFVRASIWEKKGPSLGKNVKVPHQRSPYAVNFEDRSHEETERQQRCARSKAWNLAKNIFELEEKTRLHSTFPRRNGYSGLRQQKSRRKSVSSRFQELICTWSVRKTLTLLSWRPWGHREVRRRWWRPTARIEQEK